MTISQMDGLRGYQIEKWLKNGWISTKEYNRYYKYVWAMNKLTPSPRSRLMAPTRTIRVGDEDRLVEVYISRAPSIDLAESI